MSKKNFSDLISEVHKRGICQYCGGCVSFCGSADYNVISMKDSDSLPEYIDKEKCLECGICYYICPQTHILDEELNKVYKFQDFTSMPLGFFHNIRSCQSNDEVFLKNGTDGGVVNSIIDFLLKKKKIDAAIVAKTKAPFYRDSLFAYNKEDLLDSSGLTMNFSPQLEQVQKFCSYTHAFNKINQFKFKKLAFVGTPCQIYTLRCMENLGVVPSQNIEIYLGLFCYENFLFDPSKIEKFEKTFNIKFEDIEKINIKENLILKMRKGTANQEMIQIPFKQLTDYMRPACNACRDFTNIYADISFGGLGSPDKYTTVIARTDKGKKIVQEVMDKEVIKCLKLDQATKTKMKEVITRVSLEKLERYNTFFNKIDQ